MRLARSGCRAGYGARVSSTQDVAAAYSARATEYADVLGRIEATSPHDRDTIAAWALACDRAAVSRCQADEAAEARATSSGVSHG